MVKVVEHTAYPSKGVSPDAWRLEGGAPEMGIMRGEITMTIQAKKRFRQEFRKLGSYERKEILSLLADFARIHREMETGRAG